MERKDRVIMALKVRRIIPNDDGMGSFQNQQEQAETLASRFGVKIDGRCHPYFWMVPLLKVLMDRIETLETRANERT